MSTPEGLSESLLAELAAAIHQHYRAQARKEGWTMRHDLPYTELPPEIQAASIAAARRIPQVLAVAGLQIIPVGAGTPTLTEAEALARIEARLEAAAEAEHEGWMQQKLDDGWTRGTRDDAAKLHPSLVPYATLEQVEKDKDYSAVRVYPGLLIANGFAIAEA